jgi:hypothetical protein
MAANPQMKRGTDRCAKSSQFPGYERLPERSHDSANGSVGHLAPHFMSLR